MFQRRAPAQRKDAHARTGLAQVPCRHSRRR
jgi:hypothetical protein